MTNKSTLMNAHNLKLLKTRKVTKIIGKTLLQNVEYSPTTSPGSHSLSISTSLRMFIIISN